MITQLLEMTAAEYHADIHGPSLSASIAHVLCTQSPLHAWTAHPRLNPDWQRVDRAHYEFGSACHAALLEGLDNAPVRLVEASDWRTKAAQAVRDEARERGQIPLLEQDYSRMLDMVHAVKRQLAEHEAEPALFKDGKPEQTLIWHEPDGTMCRARIDWLRDDLATIDDFKTTSRSANPEAWSRRIFEHGIDIQAAFYIRGAERLTGATPEFRLVVAETCPPYAVSVVSPGPDVLVIGQKKVDYALRVWNRCLQADSWPGYPGKVAYAELPGFVEEAWLAKEIREEAA